MIKKFNNLNKFDRIFIYFFVVLNSISGLQIRNISINSLLMILFVIFIIVKSLNRSFSNGIKIPKRGLFIFFMLSCIISCFFSLFCTYRLPHISVVTSFLINSICYLIIFILLYNINREIFFEICRAFVNGLVYAARIQVIWGLLQMILLYSKNININKILFEDILQSTTSVDWTMGFFSR